MSKHPHWQASPPAHYDGPRIALVHGLLVGRHMQNHLLTFLRNAGYADTTLYSNHLSPDIIARDVQQAAQAGRAVVMIGYSQGGFQVVKVSHLLRQSGIAVDLMVSLAAGGVGRLYPPQWGASVRRIPDNVKRHLNFFATGDTLGTDPVHSLNLAQAESAMTQVENIAYSLADGVDHKSIARCFPSDRVPPAVRTLFLDRLQQELSALGTRPRP